MMGRAVYRTPAILAEVDARFYGDRSRSGGGGGDDGEERDERMAQRRGSELGEHNGNDGGGEGRAVQVDPITPMLKAPGCERETKV